MYSPDLSYVAPSPPTLTTPKGIILLFPVTLAPAYNVTKEEIEKIVDIFVNSVEEVLREFGVQ
jgi:adenosylmethionine-8-amino-7-oxononanoate aminotransferase